jgi:hypothetical protein
MKNYQLAKIYKIVSNITNQIYIGSTCEPTLARRLAKHVGSYKSFLNGKSNYVTSYKIIELGNYDIFLIENCPCENNDELHQHERYYIETLNCVNKIIPNRTQKEWNIENKDKKYNYDKNYKIQNKDKLIEKINCLCCGGHYCYQNKSHHLKSSKHINSINNIKKLFIDFKYIKNHIDLILSDLFTNQQFQVV